MKLGRNLYLAFLSTAWVYVVAATTFFAAAEGKPSAKVQKVKVKGVIVLHEGDLLQVLSEKDGSFQPFAITDKTLIERNKGTFKHTKTDASALVPGLTVDVEGTRTPEGTPRASTIKFKPDAFAITVAQEKRIRDNKAAASRAQTTANDAVASATGAQSSADRAQTTAYEGVSTAQTAGMLAAADMVGVQIVNQRVSDLGEYTTVAGLGVYFPENSHTLSASAKSAIDEFIAAHSNVSGYVIQIAGYASGTGSAQYNQRLSAERAEAVAQYLREKDDVPALRIAFPAGYGATHPAASNADAKGRALNRRVEVTILVSKGLEEGTTTQTVLSGKNLSPQ